MSKEPLRKGLGLALRRHRKEQALSQGELAVRAGLSRPTVRLLERTRGNLASWNKTLESLELELDGRNLPAGETLGKRVAKLRKNRGLSQRALADLIGVTQQTILALERRSVGRLETLDRILIRLGAGAHLARQGSKRNFFTHVGNASGNMAWETPRELLDSLYQVFGTFDLDPCSPRKSNPPVKAHVHYTAEDDGLSLDWHGVVFVNPPYGRELPLWIEKARSEVDRGNASVVIALIPARTDTSYWHDHVAGSATVLFLRGRLKFGGSEQGAPFPSALAVWGGEPQTIERLRNVLPKKPSVVARSVPAIGHARKSSGIHPSDPQGSQSL